MFEKTTTKWSKRAGEVFHQNLGRFAEIHASGDDPAKAVELLQNRVRLADQWREKCESPIEEIMAAILPFLGEGYGYPEDDCGVEPKFGAIVRPQCEYGSIRVDFMLTSFWHGYKRRLAIECDGHDYHDKTKQQAARDKSRDRLLAVDNVVIVRYTGFELYRDPSAIRTELEKILGELIEGAAVDAGALEPRSTIRK